MHALLPYALPHFFCNCAYTQSGYRYSTLLQFRRSEQEAPSSHQGGPPGTTIGGGGNVRSRFRLREPNHRQDQNQIASAIQASMDSANAEAAHRDARQQALAQVCLGPPVTSHQPTACNITLVCLAPVTSHHSLRLLMEHGATLKAPRVTMLAG